MNPLSDPLVDRIAATWCMTEYPHKEWHTLSAEDQGWWRQDTLTFLHAIQAAGFRIEPTPT